MTSDFLSQLNPEQRQAVEQVYGPVLVMAGPGTGKTHMLTARIAHILQSGVGCEPENMLCLTFTESAAVEMRNRLQSWIGATAYRIKIMTFHGFCQWVMDRYPSIFEPKMGMAEVADDLAKALVYRTVIKQKKWEHFSSVWDDFQHKGDVLGAIGNLKREHISPAKLRDLIPAEKERMESDPDNFYKRKYKDFAVGDWKPSAKKRLEDRIAKMYELADFWEAYEAELRKRGYFDFDDMINWVVDEMASNENLRFDLQEKFQWILVDEYQDTNEAQNAIIWQLTDGIEAANIFAVGDDDQSIYRFQGASSANLKAFKNRFPDRKEVMLTHNYRSHQNILDVAYASVSLNTGRSEAKSGLVASNPAIKKQFDAGKVTRAHFTSRYGEINFLAKTIGQQIEKGTSAHEIAILVRNNREITELSRELPKFGIPVSAQIALNIFENESVRLLILMLEIFSDPAHDEKFLELLHADFLTIDPEALLQLSLKRYADKTSLISLLLDKSVSDTDENIYAFTHFLARARKNFFHCRPAVLAEKMLYESGMADFLTEQNRLGDWQNIRKFIDWIRTQNQESLKGLLDRVDLHKELQIPIRPDPLPADKKSVQIMTTHKSKGLEFEIVFIPGLEDKKWGNTRSFGGIKLPNLSPIEETDLNADDKEQRKKDDNEEERRLFFVAITRAKYQLFCTYSETDFTGRAKNPSQFWHEMPESKIIELESDALEDDLQALLPVFFQHQEKTLSKEERYILAPKTQNFVWSASSLQAFIDCPRRFLYQYLYKFPRRPNASMALGVALHEALERFLKQAQKKQHFEDKAVLLDLYEKALRGQPIKHHDFDKWFEHGTKILTTYYEQKIQNFASQYPFGYALEYDFGHFFPEVSGIRMTGKMDKVVFLDDKKSEAKIIDYKSGRPRVIKDGSAYWRQLVFYSLLASHAKGIDWKVESCGIEFLTPDAKGRIGIKEVPISKEDQLKVIEELKTADKQLKNLEFPLIPNPEGDSDIDFWQNFGR